MPWLILGKRMEEKFAHFSLETYIVGARKNCLDQGDFDELSNLSNRLFAFAKTKTQISCAVTAQLISAFVFATWIVQYLFFLNPKFPVSSHIQ